ncbi:hypothetical protein MMC28_005887, partial [Mycoblastus sanguinarius]|nr:hypothetical protein [Mycoblastus sanguinarius]
MDRLSPGIPQNELPGLQPPPGVVSNFTNPGGYQPTIIGTLTACLTIATTFTAVRLYNKAFLVKSIALED